MPVNHSCNPNVSVWHPDRRTALSRTVIAKRDIAVREELVMMFVDPSLGVCETVRGVRIQLHEDLRSVTLSGASRRRGKKGVAKMRVRVR